MFELNKGIAAHLAWKKSLLIQVNRYQAWLEHNQLFSTDIASQLSSCRKTLSSNNVTLAFVGEFSRGKTELINALLFSGLGNRLLPSRAGRTTMCPTEIFFNPSRPQSLRLLPVETRLCDKSIQQLQNDRTVWHEVKLESGDAVEISQVLDSIAHTKQVSRSDAIKLGFNPEHLDLCPDNPNKVSIPAWRHAMINIQHPLLQQGLRILDTPGFNALGSEPELTMSMLPSADVIVYLLSADTGVTASDKQVWDDYIRQIHGQRPSNLFAVLNKVDSLYDDLIPNEQITAMIEDIRQTTARQLDIPVNDVLPMSARKALQGRVQDSPEVLEQSGIMALEQLLAQELVGRQQALISQHIVKPLHAQLENSRLALQKRLKEMTAQQWRMSSSHKNNLYMISELTTRTRELHTQHHHRLLSIKSSQRLIKRQGEALSSACRPQVFRNRLMKVESQMNASLTTAGMNHAIIKFFHLIHDDIYTLGTEARLANRLISSIYERHRSLSKDNPLEPKPFTTHEYINELDTIRRRANSFRKRFSTVMSSQSNVARRFLNTIAMEVAMLNDRMARDAREWADNALRPLTQNAFEQKQYIEQQLIQIRALTLNDSSREHLMGKLDGFIQETELQLAQVDNLIKEVRRPSPASRIGNVIHLHTGAAIA
ncbi:dynamin family protein [Parendozoicomonas haliclonae]|uniref:Dynamin family protein n=1 Tax=Parendozoicomonas haliclonae TaxID=1960125 RepID=A0A1X7ALN3_9GAMM|nr:dynamin family protein [Parendozoicomonas haliclonae]SMA46191.1 Dynamin family protein [Parendozoicomonas haliclonae]